MSKATERSMVDRLNAALEGRRLNDQGKGTRDLARIYLIGYNKI